MIRSARQHLQDVEESYWKHGFFAVKWGLFIIWTGFASIVHGICPAVFKFTAPKNVLFLKSLMDSRNEEERIKRAESLGNRP